MSATRRTALAAAACFLAPAVLLLIGFRLIPAAYVMVQSLDAGAGRLGLDAFTHLAGSTGFRAAVTTTVMFNLVINPLQITLALLIAILLVDGTRRPGLWQTLLLLPVAVPLAVSSVVWGVAFRPDDGILNAVLVALGLPAQPWLTSPDQALGSVMLLASWVGVGYWTLFLVAGLHRIPTPLTEAASIDGASYWRTLWAIRLPLLRRTIAFVLVADTVANVLLFAPIQILTRGGPAGSTNLIMFDVYRNAFVFDDLPLAAAQTVIVVVVMLAIVAVQLALLDRRDADAA